MKGKRPTIYGNMSAAPLLKRPRLGASPLPKVNTKLKPPKRVIIKGK